MPPLSLLELATSSFSLFIVYLNLGFSPPVFCFDSSSRLFVSECLS